MKNHLYILKYGVYLVFNDMFSGVIVLSTACYLLWCHYTTIMIVLWGINMLWSCLFLSRCGTSLLILAYNFGSNIIMTLRLRPQSSYSGWHSIQRWLMVISFSSSKPWGQPGFQVNNVSSQALSSFMYPYNACSPLGFLLLACNITCYRSLFALACRIHMAVMNRG